MKIEGTHTETKRVEVELFFWDAFYAVRAEAFKKAGIKDPSAYVDKMGRIVVEVEYHTSHSYFEKQVLIENPTPEQVRLIELYAELQQRLVAFDVTFTPKAR